MRIVGPMEQPTVLWLCYVSDFTIQFAISNLVPIQSVGLQRHQS